jgi:hypothetical protein
VFTISNLQIKQLPPIETSAAKVQVTFDVLGVFGPDDIVQIYAGDRSGDLSNLVAKTDLNMTEHFGYSEILDLTAGEFYAIGCCPRTVTDHQVNDTIDGQDWQGLCLWQEFTTQAAPGPGTNLPAPQITGIRTLPLTLHRKNGVEVSWTSPRNYDFFQVRWGYEGMPALDEFQEKTAGGGSGSFVCSTTRGLWYHFSVQGCNSHWLTGSQCSAWSPATRAQAGANLHRLREFLEASGVATSSPLRTFLGAGGGSLRSLMGI